MSRIFVWLFIVFLAVMLVFTPDVVDGNAPHTVYLPVVMNSVPVDPYPDNVHALTITCDQRVFEVGYYWSGEYLIAGERDADVWMLEVQRNDAGYNAMQLFMSDAGALCFVTVYYEDGGIERKGAMTRVRSEEVPDARLHIDGDGIYISACDEISCDLVKYEIQPFYEFELQCIDSTMYLRAGSANGLELHGWKVDDSWRYTIDESVSPYTVLALTENRLDEPCQMKYYNADGTVNHWGMATQEYFGSVSRDERDLMWRNEGLWISMCYEDGYCNLAMFWLTW